MLKIDCNEDLNTITITPTTKLAQSDFKEITETVDGYINRHDEIPSLIIHAENFPHWDSFKAFIEHLKFVKNAQSFIPNVAIVSDSKALTVLPVLARHFVKARIRHFPEMKMEEAIQWAASGEDHPGDFKLIKGLPADVIAIELEGIITAQDYENMLVPMVDKKLIEHDKIKMLVVLDDDFQSYSAGALLDDAKFGFTHLTTLSKLAIVSDMAWVRNGMKLFGPLIPTHVRSFHLNELETAKEWIKT